jgi:hypothetical protein
MIKKTMTYFVLFFVLPYNIIRAQELEKQTPQYTKQELTGDTVLFYTKDDFKVLILNNKETLYNNKIKTFFKGEEVRDFPLKDFKYEVRDVRIFNNKYFVLTYYYKHSDAFNTYSWEDDHWIGKEYGILGGLYHPKVVPKPEKIEAIDLDKFIVTRAGKKYLLKYDQKAPRLKRVSESEIKE